MEELNILGILTVKTEEFVRKEVREERKNTFK